RFSRDWSSDVCSSDLSTRRLVAIGFEPIVEQVQVRERVPLALKLACWTWRQPDDVPLLTQLLRGVPRDTEVVENVSIHHLLSVAPQAVLVAEGADAGDVRARPLHAEVRGILRGGKVVGTVG